MFALFQKLAKFIQNEKGLCIALIRSDHDEESRIRNDIWHTFSIPRTHRQNGVMDRKNISLEKPIGTILNETNLSKYFWTNVVSICHLTYTTEKKLNISHLYVFGCKCFILNNVKDDLEKIDVKVDEGIFIRYSTLSNFFRVFKKRTLTIEEYFHSIFDEINIP